MVTVDDITRMAALMRITINESDEYVEKIQKMLEYFQVLDSAGVGDEAIPTQDVCLADLRDDEHHPYDMGLEGYVRAPGLG